MPLDPVGHLQARVSGMRRCREKPSRDGKEVSAMEAHQIDPLLAELRDRVGRLERREGYLEQVVARLIEHVWQLVKPAREREA